MRRREHEEKVLGAALLYIGKLTGETLTTFSRPEARERRRKTVDLLAQGSSSKYAIEHTRIESFDGQILDNYQFSDLLGPIPLMVAGFLPAENRFVLSVGTKAVKGVKDPERVRNALITWIHEKAPLLKPGSNRHLPGTYVREFPPDVPFEVSLSRWHSRRKGLTIGRLEPGDLEEQRQMRIRTALAEKCPKLHRAKSGGRVSVLVLESDDLALANCSLVASAVLEELKTRDDVPDQIYLVETEAEPWAVWTIKCGSPVFPDTPASDPLYVYPAMIPRIPD